MKCSIPFMSNFQQKILCYGLSDLYSRKKKGLNDLTNYCVKWPILSEKALLTCIILKKTKNGKETFSIFCIGEFASITISFGD